MPTGPLPQPGPHRGLREVRLLRNTVIPLKAPHSAARVRGRGEREGALTGYPLYATAVSSQTQRTGGALAVAVPVFWMWELTGRGAE